MPRAGREGEQSVGLLGEVDHAARDPADSRVMKRE
jgi:hypothetical protein